MSCGNRTVPRRGVRLSRVGWAAALLFLGTGHVHAAITCGPMSTTSASFAYVPGTNNNSASPSGANNVVMNTVTVSCTRDSASPNTVQLGVTNGLHAPPGNRAQLVSPTPFYVRYNTFQDAACMNTLTDGSGNRLTATLTAPLNTPQSITYTFYTCINQAQTLASFPAGVYTDAPNVNLRFQGGGLAIDQTQPMPVSINAPAACSISNLPASNSIPLTYTAFQSSPAFNFVSFNANCTNLLPYTMSLDSQFGVVGGLRYQLGLTTTAQGSAAAVGGTTAADVGGPTGTKVHYINAVMSAGQAGQIGLPTSNSHVLTIAY
jgi:Spore Coat Protein U domain